MRVSDTFVGEKELLKLSQRLMDWYDVPVSDQEIIEVLGEDLLPVFRFAQAKLKGRVRRVTLEPAFCHSADVSFRAVALGYPERIVKAAFLHDVVEDTCSGFAQIPAAITEISNAFGKEVAKSVTFLTNRYQLIFKTAARKVSGDVPFSPRSRCAFRAALSLVRCEQPVLIAERFAREFEQLATFLEVEADLVRGSRIASRDRKFKVSTYLERQVYRLYVDDLVVRAAAATRGEEPIAALDALVIKLLDVTDNIRTSEVSNRLSLFKLINKAEMLLDKVARTYLQGVSEKAAKKSTVSTLHRLVQLRLVDQLDARRRAVADNFTETRFLGLVAFLDVQRERLAEKFAIETDSFEDIQQLRDAIRMQCSIGYGVLEKD